MHLLLALCRSAVPPDRHQGGCVPPLPSRTKDKLAVHVHSGVVTCTLAGKDVWGRATEGTWSRFSARDVIFLAQTFKGLDVLVGIRRDREGYGVGKSELRKVARCRSF